MATPDTKLHVEVMRSQLGRVRGLGAARSGVEVWWVERLTSIALIPLTLWFVYAVLHLAGAPQNVVRIWVAAPWNTVLLLALIVTTFHHMQLGLTVVIEDYVHVDFARMAMMLGVRAVSALLALACIVATLKLAF